MDLRSLIRAVPNFPQEGILFRDITPLIQNPTGLRVTIEQLSACLGAHDITVVTGIESRGFIFGVPLSYHLGVGFVPVRKPGKLPPPVITQTYSLEYGSDCLEIRDQSFKPDDRVVIVDDLLATGGTASATAQLVKQAGGTIVAFAFVIELSSLKGRQALPPNIPVYSLISYNDED